jgi:uncharacterized coiled-coil protein SlyX
MSTEFGRLLTEVLHSMESGTGFEKLKAVMDIYERNFKLEARIAELEAEHVVWLNGAENIVKRLKGEIAELEALVEKLVDEGCVIAERFSARGGSEIDLEDWENVLDEYREICPPLSDGEA